MSDVSIYLWPERDAQNSKEYDQLLASFNDLKPAVDRRALLPRGGLDMQPLTAYLLISAGIVAKWIIDGIGSDFYKALRSAVRKMLRVRQTAPKELAANIRYCKLVLHFEYKGHIFIADFEVDSGASMQQAIREMPELIDRLAQSQQPMQYLILWDGKKWDISQYPMP